jgi:hypothetical protein
MSSSRSALEISVPFTTAIAPAGTSAVPPPHAVTASVKLASRTPNVRRTRVIE